MVSDSSGQGESTRRDYVKYGGAIGVGTLLAGCTGGESTPTPASNDSTATETPEQSYTVELSPVGEVTFDGVPEDVMAYSPQYADMLVAFGQAGKLNSLGFPESYGKNMAYFLDALDGVEFDWSDLTKLFAEGSFDKELLYELDSDVHLMDPAWVSAFDSWDTDDTEEVREQVGPWFGNRYSREHTKPPAGWRDDYRYYTLWELSGKVAQVFDAEARFEALREEYDRLYGTIRSNLPPEGERPTVGLVAFSDGKFYPYEISGPGFGKAHTRPMGAPDAFADSDRTYDENYGGTYDFEGMLEIDPDVILHNFATTSFYDWDQVKETVTTDEVGKELTAVKNDRFYAGGGSFQGPLKNLFQLEMTAKQVYPEQFGEWPRFEEGDSYPDIPQEEQLFDHQRVADIVNGDR